MKLKSKHIDRIIHMALLLIFIIGIVLAMLSCKTLKQKETATETTHANVNTSTSTQTDVKNNVVANTQLDRKTSNLKQLADNSYTQEITEETSVTTNFSKPDKSGKQYPTSKNTTTKTTKKGENKNIKSSNQLNEFEKTAAALEDHSQIKAEATKDSTDKSKSKIVKKSDINKKVTTPIWVTIISSLSVFIVLGVISYFVYLILKRYNLI